MAGHPIVGTSSSSMSNLPEGLRRRSIRRILANTEEDSLGESALVGLTVVACISRRLRAALVIDLGRDDVAGW